MVTKRKGRFRISLAALALFLVVGQPFTALAAEPGQDSLEALSRETAQSVFTRAQETFRSRLDDRTDHGRPLEGTTRGQYIQILYEAVGTPAVTIVSYFDDVAVTADYAAAVAWARESGVISIVPTDCFRPEDTVTQQEAEEMLARTVSALSGAVQQMAGSILAAYTGRTDESQWALPPASLAALLNLDEADANSTALCPAGSLSGSPPAQRRGSVAK